MSKRHFFARSCRTAAAAALGLTVSASAAPAQAGKLTGPGTSPVIVAKATFNPVRPRAIRDHRLLCPQLVPKPGSCPGVRIASKAIGASTIVH
jgi:hypothetical protein